MKTYPEIPGPSKSPKLPCIVFDKLDGSNLRFEWSKKRGWYKFGTRARMFDHTDPEYGRAIPVFLNRYGDSLPKVITDNKDYRGIDSFIAYGEFFGPSSFAGWHDFTEQQEVVLFDVNLNKKGFVLPRAFVNDFGHLKIPKVIYEGNFGDQFVKDVKDGKYDVVEGVVAKGVIPKKNPQHGLWMSKVKTKAWLAELRHRAQTCPEFRKALTDNIKEQAG